MRYGLFVASLLRRWHHLAFTYDGSLITLYIDGTRDCVATQSLSTQGRNLFIGRALTDHASKYFWVGAVDELRHVQLRRMGR